MRKALTIAWSEFITALSSKAFLISIIFVPALMGGSIFFQRTMGQRADLQPRPFAVIDHTGVIYPVLQMTATVWNSGAQRPPGAPPGPKFIPSIVTPPADRPIEQVRLELSQRIEKKELFAFVEIPAEAVKDGGRKAPIRYYSNSPSYNALPNWLDAVINQSINAHKLQTAGVDLMLLKTLNEKTPLESLGLLRQRADGQAASAEKVDRIKTMAIPIVLMTLMFMVIMSSASPLLNSVMEEKLTRISEVMLGSVTPFELMLGKLVGSLAVSVTLSLVYMVVGIVAASYWGYGNAMPPSIAAWFVIYLIMAIMMFGAAFMAIGAACSDLKDAQGMMTPIMLIFVLPFLVWSPVLQNPDSLFSTVVSLIPVASPMLMLLRLSIQPGPPWWQVGLSLALTLATSMLFVWAAGRIFRTGILMQGKSATLGEMIRWVKA
jgi:ABC-2 type transport system permease protein